MPDIGKYAPGFPSPPTFEDPHEERDYLKGRLAAAFRIFGAKGFGKGVSGHISCRDPVEPNTFWLNAFGQSFATIRRSDLVRVDHHGNVIQAGRYRLINRAAIMIHVAVHEARPDVVCVAHAHSLYGRAFSALKIDLPILSQDACMFHNDLSTLPFEGIVLEGDEGTHIANALGQRKAILLQNHGLLTVANTVEATVFWYVSLEELSQGALASLAAVGGDLSKLSIVQDEFAQVTYKSVGLPLSGWFSAKPLFDEIAEQTHESFLA
ncbi:hypothetical protein M409DRAFT_35733 [Zasmidium cellare ATCC 36951]|uniref:Class II aldolase/adducin N-terminal domain-containing protein n=1 Tax=Zasmidium cellare ATCC 36951 TaxID=1080233 RepID=A0A6A6D0F6_ZASCE|nr:uncharacterized protein M409DRAFT_35733 [Zasmidium cellare ATCC 36951]KAF2171940.1 hypothetical protein M409DRAFT_35733 [Zasmidium cellare ATCC 36951]